MEIRRIPINYKKIMAKVKEKPTIKCNEQISRKNHPDGGGAGTKCNIPIHFYIFLRIYTTSEVPQRPTTVLNSCQGAVVGGSHNY